MKNKSIRSRFYGLLLAVLCLTACTEKPKVPIQTSTSPVPLHQADTSTQRQKLIRTIFQDQSGVYWFGTNNDGVCRYDGQNFTWYTMKDGLSDNQIQSVQEVDKSSGANAGIWLGTANGVSHFNGGSFTSYETKSKVGTPVSARDAQHAQSGDIWFGYGEGACWYDGKELHFLPISNTPADMQKKSGSRSGGNPYSAYSLLKDRSGNIWVGTEQRGVCRYDGKSFRWFRGDDLEVAVRAIFEDRAGNIWVGNNGGGVYRFDGKNMVNFTAEKGLSNPGFIRGKGALAGTLARIWSIDEDDSGNIWFTTMDSGVWRFDGTNLTNFTTREGLPSNAVSVVYKDQSGTLWFATDAGLCRYTGDMFLPFALN